ncbi:hypothetical protein ASZ90_007166 [hydrocarbon metagenome]|uniref:Methyltransferase FkbM domain-containing protein n=1 Tax=hydrocarbon metagenome TaxID=938273 RepID=A0A0W8FQ67_9ZZZZ
MQIKESFLLIKIIRFLIRPWGYDIVPTKNPGLKVEKKIIEYFNLALIKREHPAYQTSYSQVAEDIIVSDLFYRKNNSLPSYLELGVESPIYINNTYKFYKRGSNGVLVEANPKHIEQIKKNRPNDKLISSAVGVNEAESVNLYYLQNGCESISKEEAEFREKAGHKINEVTQIPCSTINKIIEQNFQDGHPDFLSIDIEGMDLDVLKTLDFEKYPIPVICAETLIFGGLRTLQRNNEIINFLTTKGYFVYADTYINTIFVNKDWYLKK